MIDVTRNQVEKADLFRDTQKKTAPKASDKSAVEHAFDDKRITLNNHQEVNAKDKLEADKEKEDVEKIRKTLVEAEQKVAKRERTPGIAYQRQWRLHVAEKEFEIAANTYTEEMSRKYKVNGCDDKGA